MIAHIYDLPLAAQISAHDLEAAESSISRLRRKLQKRLDFAYDSNEIGGVSLRRSSLPPLRSLDILLNEIEVWRIYQFDRNLLGSELAQAASLCSGVHKRIVGVSYRRRNVVYDARVTHDINVTALHGRPTPVGLGGAWLIISVGNALRPSNDERAAIFQQMATILGNEDNLSIRPSAHGWDFIPLDKTRIVRCDYAGPGELPYGVRFRFDSFSAVKDSCLRLLESGMFVDAVSLRTSREVDEATYDSMREELNRTAIGWDVAATGSLHRSIEPFQIDTWRADKSISWIPLLGWHHPRNYQIGQPVFQVMVALNGLGDDIHLELTTDSDELDSVLRDVEKASGLQFVPTLTSGV